MENNYNPQRPRKRVSRKVLRRRQFSALAVISFIILLIVVLASKGCHKSENSGNNKKNNKNNQTAVVTTITVQQDDVTFTMPPTETTAVEAEPTTANPAASKVQLSKREMFLDVGDTDVSIIRAYPEGSTEANEQWKSSDTSIATVDKQGYVTAVAPGSCYIILSFSNQPDIEIEIKVSVADNGVTALPKSTESATDEAAEGQRFSGSTDSSLAYENNVLVSNDLRN